MWNSRSSDEGTEQGLSPSPGIVDELEEAEIGGQIFLRDAPMWPQPGAQQRPEAFEGIDVNFAEAVTILVAGIVALSVADRLVPVASGCQTGIDVVLIGVDERSCGHARRDDRPDRRLLNVFQHVQNDVAAPLDQTEDRRLFLLQRAPAGGAFPSAAPAGTVFFATATGLPVCPAPT